MHIASQINNRKHSSEQKVSVNLPEGALLNSNVNYFAFEVQVVLKHSAMCHNIALAPSQKCDVRMEKLLTSTVRLPPFFCNSATHTLSH